MNTPTRLATFKIKKIKLRQNLHLWSSGSALRTSSSSASRKQECCSSRTQDLKLRQPGEEKPYNSRSSSLKGKKSGRRVWKSGSMKLQKSMMTPRRLTLSRRKRGNNLDKKTSDLSQMAQKNRRYLPAQRQQTSTSS
jgi:hypothetical protein